jgi:hypothetical protein
MGTLPNNLLIGCKFKEFEVILSGRILSRKELFEKGGGTWVLLKRALNGF